jgi:hypothetical protein
LDNTTGLFGVFGNGTAGSGGVIQGAVSGGIYLQDTGLTGLQWMTINNNLVGIHADTVSQLVLESSSITNSTTNGIFAINTPLMTIVNSTFSGNGAANLNAQFNVAGATYAYTINGSQFVSTTSDNLDFLGTGTLNFSAQNSLFANSATGTSGINLNWNGSLATQINQSSFVEAGNSITGVLINNGPSDFSSVALTNNAYSTTGTSGVGFHFTGQGTSVLTATHNAVQFTGISGIGFETSIVTPSATFANNTVTDTAGGATGFQFDSVTGPGTVILNGNTVTLSNGGNGIDFLNVPTTFQLQGAISNTITGATTSFFAPPGTTTGSILVNGVATP